MSHEQLSAHLMRLDIFQGLSPLQLTEIARRAERLVYKPGQLLIADGEPGDAAVLVISGDTIRTKGHFGTSPHEAVEPGSLLGEMAMLIETDYSSTVVAVGTVKAMRLRRQAMMEMMLDDPTLAEHFLGKVNRRLTRLAHEMRTVDATLVSALDTIVAAERQLPAPAEHAAH